MTWPVVSHVDTLNTVWADAHCFKLFLLTLSQMLRKKEQTNPNKPIWKTPQNLMVLMKTHERPQQFSSTLRDYVDLILECSVLP